MLTLAWAELNELTMRIEHLQARYSAAKLTESVGAAKALAEGARPCAERAGPSHFVDHGSDLGRRVVSAGTVRPPVCRLTARRSAAIVSRSRPIAA